MERGGNFHGCEYETIRLTFLWGLMKQMLNFHPSHRPHLFSGRTVFWCLLTFCFHAIILKVLYESLICACKIEFQLGPTSCSVRIWLGEGNSRWVPKILPGVFFGILRSARHYGLRVTASHTQPTFVENICYLYHYLIIY